MKGVYVCYFGSNKEGVTTYRVNGELEDLVTIIDEAKNIGYAFFETPIVEKSHKHYSVLLRLYVPEEYYINAQKTI